MKEGRRDLGNGEESRDEVRPSEMANALPGKLFAHVGAMVRVEAVVGWKGCGRLGWMSLSWWGAWWLAVVDGRAIVGVG